MRMQLEKSHGLVALVAAMLTFGCTAVAARAGFFPHYRYAETAEHDLIMHVNDGFKYTSELLACGDLSELSNAQMSDLENDIESIIDDSGVKSELSTVAVYLRDLNNGPWLSINSKQTFYPASLLKVPLIFAVYKTEEAKPGLMESLVHYTGPRLNSQYKYPPAELLVAGKDYTVRELLRHAIVFSDNEAAALIADVLGFDRLTEIYGDIGIPKPEAGKDYLITVRDYASFFRILYNASYISRSHSEEALALLTQSTFKDGIVAGVPEDVPVAHKFGEREGPPGTSHVQLHDCGVVYAKGHPYLLCIMAQARSDAQITALMKQISQKVYTTMASSN